MRMLVPWSVRAGLLMLVLVVVAASVLPSRNYVAANDLSQPQSDTGGMPSSSDCPKTLTFQNAIISAIAEVTEQAQAGESIKVVVGVSNLSVNEAPVSIRLDLIDQSGTSQKYNRTPWTIPGGSDTGTVGESFLSSVSSHT